LAFAKTKQSFDSQKDVTISPVFLHPVRQRPPSEQHLAEWIFYFSFPLLTSPYEYYTNRQNYCNKVIHTFWLDKAIVLCFYPKARLRCFTNLA